MVVELVESWSTEAGRIGSTEAEIAWCIHQGHLRRQMVLEGLMVSQSQSKSSREVLKEPVLVLGIGSKGVYILLDIA